MNKWKIFTITSVSCVAASLVVGPCIALGVETYYKNHTVTIDNTKPKIDLDSAYGSINVSFPVQPDDNLALISVFNNQDKNFVTLFRDGEQPYESTSSLLFFVENKHAKVNLCFDTFKGVSTKSSFNLEVTYERNGKVETTTIDNMELSVEYNHPENETVHILSLNDFHGAAVGFGDDDPDETFKSVSYKNPGAIRVARDVSQVLDKYPGSILVTAGDNNSGEAFSTSTHAATMYPILKAMGARYSAVGNHAFDWGLENLAAETFDKWARTDKTEGKYLICSNILDHPWFQQWNWMYDIDWTNPTEVEQLNNEYTMWKNQLVDWAEPFKLVSLNGHLVCLLGLTTKEAMTDGNQAVVNSYSIMGFNKEVGLPYDNYAAALYYASRDCYEKVGWDWYNSIESFVVLSHVGSLTDEEIAKGKESEAHNLAKDILIFDPSCEGKPCDKNPTQKLSAVISGHSHKVVNAQVENKYTHQPVLVGQAETAGRKYLDVSLTFNNNSPVGQRCASVKQDVVPVKIEYGPLDPFDPAYPYEKWTADEKARAKAAAQNEISKLHSNPPSDYLKGVVDEYYKNEEICKQKLGTVVGHTITGAKYSPLTSGKQLGHEYIWADNLNDEMGAWINLAQIIGFDIEFYDEIISPDSNVTFPAISFFNMDSITSEFKPDTDLKLSDIYSLQGYENSIYFGYLSIWQLANIVDYILSGSNSFVYGSENNRNYTTEAYDEEGNPHDSSDPDFSHSFAKNTRCSEDSALWPICLDDTDDKDINCKYLCGPLQWFGFSIAIEPEDHPEVNDRQWKLKYATSKDGINVPGISVYHPDEKTFIRGTYNLETWKSGSYYKNNEELIPVVINSFLYEGGNGQATIFEKYMKYNEKQDKKYTVHHYSTISRELLEVFCSFATEQKLIPFDVNEQVFKFLVRYD